MGASWLFLSDWVSEGWESLSQWYEAPVGACCLTEHVGPLLLPVECQQAGLQQCTPVNCKVVGEKYSLSSTS